MYVSCCRFALAARIPPGPVYNRNSLQDNSQPWREIWLQIRCRFSESCAAAQPFVVRRPSYGRRAAGVSI